MLLTTELDKLSGTDWQLFFAQERAKPYFAELDAFVTAAAAEKNVYPAAENIFAAFRACPVSAVRVVILGQDPYHEPGQAMGLSFSVPDGCKAPPSLRNIFKELEAELGPSCAAHTDLTLWARQGVLLLNTVLTVRAHQANSHRGMGWEQFTDAAIRILNEQERPIVFILWGSPAQKKAQMLNNPKHLILKAPHPSPLSAYRGFFGSRPFSQTNEFLVKNGLEPIDWQIENV